jgi:hypothetical protein
LPRQTANVVYFQRKIQLSRFAAYLDGLLSHSIWVSGIFFYYKPNKLKAHKKWGFSGTIGNAMNTVCYKYIMTQQISTYTPHKIFMGINNGLIKKRWKYSTYMGSVE